MIIHGKRTPSILSLAERLQDCNVSIRWGGNQIEGAINGQCRILDGLEQLEVLKSKNIPVPHFTTNKDEVRQIVESFDFQVYFGRKLNHSQGKDIRVSDLPRLRGQRKWYNSDYFVRFYDSLSEWRFHVFNDKSIARGKKVFTLDGQEPQYPIRSRRNGYKMVHNIEPPSLMRKIAKEAVKAIVYDLGAVDILELNNGCEEDNRDRYCVLEVNSRPGLKDNYTLSAYESAFRNYYTNNV